MNKSNKYKRPDMKTTILLMLAALLGGCGQSDQTIAPRLERIESAVNELVAIERARDEAKRLELETTQRLKEIKADVERDLANEKMARAMGVAVSNLPPELKLR